MIELSSKNLIFKNLQDIYNIQNNIKYIKYLKQNRYNI